MASSSLRPLLQHRLHYETSAWRSRTASRPGAAHLRPHSNAWNFQAFGRTVFVVARAEDGPASRKGREEDLWRSELKSQAESTPSSWPEDSLLQRTAAEAELQLQAQQQAKLRTSTEDDNKGGVMKLIGSLVEKLLIADFFFILLILAWFLAGLAEKAAFDKTNLIDVWFLFWSPVFQPALGFFMAAALWTAVSNWLNK